MVFKVFAALIFYTSLIIFLAGRGQGVSERDIILMVYWEKVPVHHWGEMMSLGKCDSIWRVGFCLYLFSILNSV